MSLFSLAGIGKLGEFGKLFSSTGIWKNSIVYLRTATEDAMSSRRDPLVADDRQTTVETAEEF